MPGALHIFCCTGNLIYSFYMVNISCTFPLQISCILQEIPWDPAHFLLLYRRNLVYSLYIMMNIFPVHPRLLCRVVSGNIYIYIYHRLMGPCIFVVVYIVVYILYMHFLHWSHMKLLGEVPIIIIIYKNLIRNTMQMHKTRKGKIKCWYDTYII